MADPVTDRLARTVGIPISSVDLIVALAFGLLLESIARIIVAGRPVHVAVTAGNGATVSRAADMPSVGASRDPGNVTVAAGNGSVAATQEKEQSQTRHQALGVELAQLAGKAGQADLPSLALLDRGARLFRDEQDAVIAGCRAGEAAVEAAFASTASPAVEPLPLCA